MSDESTTVTAPGGSSLEAQQERAEQLPPR